MNKSIALLVGSAIHHMGVGLIDGAVATKKFIASNSKDFYKGVRHGNPDTQTSVKRVQKRAARPRR